MADGEWHDFEEEIVPALSKLITPGRAMRKVEGARIQGGGPAVRARPRSDAAIIRSGRIQLIRDAIRAPNFEFDPPGHVPRGSRRMVRLVRLPAKVGGGSPNTPPGELVELIREAAPEGVVTSGVRTILLREDRPAIEAALLLALGIREVR